MENVAGDGEYARVSYDYLSLSLFGSVMAGALVVVPVFGYYVGYTWVDWALLVVLYFASGLGITV